MLIAISGSQGSGKSTLLEELGRRGYKTIARKSARSILKDWNVTLDEVNGDHELTVEFQNEITKRKWDDEKEALRHRDSIWFTERTHADLFVYALIDLGRINSYSAWVDKYYKTCMQYNQYYHRVYYLRAGMFTVENDGVRGVNQHYSRMADVTMLDVTQAMIHPSRFQIIDTASLTQRADLIDVQCKVNI